MKLLCIGLLAAAAPAFAQHDAHSTSESVTQTPSTTDPHAGHVMPAPESTPQDDPMADHDMSAMGDPASGPAMMPPPPEAFSGPRHAADTLFDSAVMAGAREHLRNENGDIETFWFIADRLETRIRNGEDGYLWDAQGWYGGDINKLWVKTEGEANFDESPEQIELQALWSHAFMPWFDFQAGIRQDFRPGNGPEQTHLVLGLQGLVPYEFEIDAAAFLSDKGDVTARFEAEFDQRITQRLILQLRTEIDLAAQDIPELAIGSGLNSGEIGLRLRYEFAREFAPYIGVEYGRRFGETGDFARAAGEDAEETSFVIGLRAWF